MKPRFKVLQLQPDYNVKTHDFADLGEQIVKSLPAERFEVTSGFLSGRPLPGQPLSVAQPGCVHVARPDRSQRALMASRSLVSKAV